MLTFPKQSTFPLWNSGWKIRLRILALQNSASNQMLLFYCLKHLPLSYLLSLHSGWKRQPQDLGIWPDWKAPLFFSLHSANRRKCLCQHVTYITLPHHSELIPWAAKIYSRNKSKLIDRGSSSQFELLKAWSAHAPGCISSHGELCIDQLRPETKQDRST